MKRSIIIIMAWLVTLGMTAQNSVFLSAAEGNAGEEVTVSISLNNTDAVSAVEMSIPMNELLNYVPASATVGSRCQNHTVTAGVKDGKLNIIIYSLTMASITGDSGEIATFRLKLGNQPTSVYLSPSALTLTNAEGNEVSGSANGNSITIYCPKAEYSTMTVDFGRVAVNRSDSKVVNIRNVGNKDLVVKGFTLSDYVNFSTEAQLPMTITPYASASFTIKATPTKRGNLQKMLKVECNSISKLNTLTLIAEAFTVNELHVGNASGISDTEVTIPLTVNNEDAISGFQFEFDLPEQLTFIEGSFELSGRKSDHVIATSVTGQKVKVVAYSGSGSAFTGNDGEIASFKVKLSGRKSVTLNPSKAILTSMVDGSAVDVLSAVYGGQITITSPTISASSTLDFGPVPVTEDCEKAFAILNAGSAPLTVSRITFDNSLLSVKEQLPIVVPPGGNSNVTVVYNSVEQKAFSGMMNIYSNDPGQRLWTVNVTGSRFAPNYFNVSIADVEPEDNLNIEIDVNIYDAISGIQFDLEYPSTEYEPYNDNVTLENRASGMTVTSRKIAPGTLRYFCYYLSGGSVAAGNGKVMTIQLKPVEGQVAEGYYTLSVKNIKLGTSELADKYAGEDATITFHVGTSVPITITANNDTRMYGEANPVFGYSMEGGTIVGQPTITCTATATSPVGTYPITISKGTVSNNNVTYVAGTLTITKAPLTISGGTYTMKQGEALPEFKASYEGWKNNETEAVLTTKPTLTTTATSQSAPGTYDVVVAGAEAQNYELAYVKGTLTIMEADPVKITANDLTMEYGDAIPELTFKSEGAKLVGTPALNCEATSTSPVGTYPITVSKGAVENYNVTYVAGTLTITKAPLTIRGGTYTMKQGEALPEFKASYEGWKNNETEAVLTTKPTLTTTATSQSAPGTYDVVVAGAEAQNYAISCVNGLLTIEKNPTGIAEISITHPVDVYTLQGQKVRTLATTLEGLPTGIYIINGRKVSVK